MTAAARSTAGRVSGVDESMSWCTTVYMIVPAPSGLLEVEGFLVPCVLCGQAVKRLLTDAPTVRYVLVFLHVRAEVSEVEICTLECEAPFGGRELGRAAGAAR
jgi:hypothetical protein